MIAVAVPIVGRSAVYGYEATCYRTILQLTREYFTARRRTGRVKVRSGVQVRLDAAVRQINHDGALAASHRRSKRQSAGNVNGRRRRCKRSAHWRCSSSSRSVHIIQPASEIKRLSNTGVTCVEAYHFPAAVR